MSDVLTDVKAIIEAVRNRCNLIWLENLNLRGDYKVRILEWVHENHPELGELPIITNYFYHEEVKNSAKRKNEG